MKEVFCDQDHVRYQHYKKDDRPDSVNWLFIPGGPGADSSYMKGLADIADLPGNVWLIDLPGNGDNVSNTITDNFDVWFSIFERMVKQFSNAVVVGHSFGGIISLLYPTFEEHLRGLVLLNSTPKFWAQEAVDYSKQFDLPDYTIEMQEFVQNPSQETFNAALKACMPYYFSKENLEKGANIFLQVPFNFRPALWCQHRGAEGKLDAKWIPQKVPTLIIGAKYDCMCPAVLFTKDPRFQRNNITLTFLEEAGHCPWVDAPEATRLAFARFIHEQLML